MEKFNEHFGVLFPKDFSTASAGEVPFVEAVAVREAAQFDGAAHAVKWHFNALPAGLSADEKRKEKQAQRQRDAAAVRAIVERWQVTRLPERRTEPWRIAVLVRSRNHLTEIVGELKGGSGRQAIPFRAINIDSLEERQEVLDLTALTRALLHPADRVAWLAVLRAPWCGLELGDLHVLTGVDDAAFEKWCVEDLIVERGHLLSDAGCERLQRLWPVMQAAARQRGRLTTAQWVERTWRSLGGDAYLSNEEMENARRYLRLLDEMEQETGSIDLGQLQDRLTKLYAESPARADAVELVTIHKAKGLEWDVVIVPAMERTARSGWGRLLTWEEIDSGDDDAAHVLLAPIEGRGQDSRELNEWLKGVRKEREAAERKRLFYVACTRAREELHLFAAPEAKENGEIRLRAGTLLEAAWPAAENICGCTYRCCGVGDACAAAGAWSRSCGGCRRPAGASSAGNVTAASGMVRSAGPVCRSKTSPRQGKRRRWSCDAFRAAGGLVCGAFFRQFGPCVSGGAGATHRCRCEVNRAAERAATVEVANRVGATRRWIASCADQARGSTSAHRVGKHTGGSRWRMDTLRAS